MKTILLLLFGLLAFSPVEASVHQGEDEQEIRHLLESRDRQIKSILAGREKLDPNEKERLRTIVNEIISFREMGQAALGPHWGGLSQEDRVRFVDVFGSIVREQSLADLDPYRARVTVESVNVKGDSAFATTTAVYKEIPTTVDYTLLRIDDAWWIIDIALDEVSTVDGYARSFQNVIRKKGFDSLMASLDRRLEKMTQVNDV